MNAVKSLIPKSLIKNKRSKADKRQNVELARGVNAISSNGLSKTNGRHNFHGKGAQEKKTTESGAVNSKWYPADHIPKPLASAKTKRNSVKTAKLRKSITPGTILILLSGRFRGKRVVFLKQLKSGALLVTGPYKVNGVPLRRVNQAYVIATSSKIDISGAALPEVDDAYFKREKASGKNKDQEEFFAQSAAAPEISQQRKSDQKSVDKSLLSIIAKEPMLSAYLNAKFSLTQSSRPHEMQF